MLIPETGDEPAADFYAKLSEESTRKLKALGVLIYRGFETEFSREICTIGITECEDGRSPENFFFRMILNLSLNIYVRQKFNSGAASEYFGALASRLETEKTVHFAKMNSLF